MSENEITLSGGVDLVKRSELYEPMLYYGARRRIAIDYISDIHLLHHVRYYNNDLRKTVRVMAKSLYDSISWGMQVFLGDVSSDRYVTIAFYKQYRVNAMYRQYKQFKRTLVSADDILSFKRKQSEAQGRSDNLAKYIDKKETEFKKLKTENDKHVNYSKVIAPKGGLANIKSYLKSTYYKKRKLPYSVTEKILMAARLKDELLVLEQSRQKIDWIVTAECPDKIIELRDFNYEAEEPIGLVILGNHEYIGFADVDEAVEFYRKELEPLGYIVLQNEFVENDRAVVYGGSGFAKYSKNFNADNLVCCEAMEGNRTYEIEQTTLFENGYEEAKKHAKEMGKCFICAAHYPIECCLGKFDREAVYFTGHTHMNERVQTEYKVLYADNQVGYHQNGEFNDVIRFKQVTMDSVTNPYGDLEDGYYQTTPDAYLQFYDYVGEYIGEGKLIRKRCATGKLYVIKSQGYYGFFVVNKSGISIVNGGMTKNIALSKNIEWIYNNFNIVVRKYLAVLEPLRARQVRISQVLKKLGFEGTIHGLIVDIDFFNHVMVDPINGSIVFYYAPTFGQVQIFESFQKQLEFMGYASLLESKAAESECNELALCRYNMLASVENNDVLSEMLTVSRSAGVYGVSRAVNPLQRLFSGHVLRDFDLRLIEVKDGSAIVRRVSMCGRVYVDRNFIHHLVIYDDLGEFIKLLDEHGKESVITVLKLRSSMYGSSYPQARWETLSIGETVEKCSKILPSVWRNAIQKMLPKANEERKFK